MILGGSRGQELWTSFPGVPGLAPLVLGVVASLAWDLLWRAALAEGAADSASFSVTGCTEGCGGSGVFGWGCLPWGFPIGEAGAFGLWRQWEWFWLSGGFFGAYALPPYSHVVHLWGLCWVT